MWRASLRRPMPGGPARRRARHLRWCGTRTQATRSGICESVPSDRRGDRTELREEAGGRAHRRRADGRTLARKRTMRGDLAPRSETETPQPRGELRVRREVARRASFELALGTSGVLVRPIERRVRWQPRHWITSSARSSNGCGTVSPSAFAAFRLITSSNLCTCSTGRSAGLVPFRILST